MTIRGIRNGDSKLKLFSARAGPQGIRKSTALRTWWLESAELVQMASDQQMERYEGDPWEEVIACWLEARSSVSISEVLEKCLQNRRGCGPKRIRTARLAV